MPADLKDLEARLALCTPADTLRGMFFRGLTGALVQELGPNAAAEVEALFPKRRRVDFLSYPLTDWLPALYRSAALLESKLGADGAFRRLGEQAVGDFFTSPAGKTLLLLSMGHPAKLMQSTPTAYQVAISWGTRRMELSSRARCLGTFERELVPVAFHEGVLAKAIGAVGGKDVRVVGTQAALTLVRLTLEWR